MSDDYLWDGSGTPDPEVQRLERALGALRHNSTWRPALAGRPDGPAEAGPYVRSVRGWLPLLATAAVVTLAVSLVWRAPTTSWEVNALNGSPRVGAETVAASAQMSVGQTLTTDASSRARIAVSTIGNVTVEPNSRVRFVETTADRHQLSLQRGTIHAVISAPPGQFVVDTPSATATDLGCEYTLHVDDEGSGRLSVDVGWVAFELNGRESFVPGGASATMNAVYGPGTPSFDDATPAFHAALDRFDFGPASTRSDALAMMIREAHHRDALTLWHLLSRVDARDRGAVYDALAVRIPPPNGVTKDAVLRLDRASLDAWWESLELGDVSFWRSWITKGVAGRPLK